MFSWSICTSVALSTVFADQYEVGRRLHFQFCPWWHDLEFASFARFTPGPEYQSLSTLTCKARSPLPGMRERNSTEGLN